MTTDKKNSELPKNPPTPSFSALNTYSFLPQPQPPVQSKGRVRKAAGPSLDEKNPKNVKPESEALVFNTALIKILNNRPPQNQRKAFKVSGCLIEAFSQLFHKNNLGDVHLERAAPYQAWEKAFKSRMTLEAFQQIKNQRYLRTLKSNFIHYREYFAQDTANRVASFLGVKPSEAVMLRGPMPESSPHVPVGGSPSLSRPSDLKLVEAPTKAKVKNSQALSQQVGPDAVMYYPENYDDTTLRQALAKADLMKAVDVYGRTPLIRALAINQPPLRILLYLKEMQKQGLSLDTTRFNSETAFSIAIRGLGFGRYTIKDITTILAAFLIYEPRPDLKIHRAPCMASLDKRKDSSRDEIADLLRERMGWDIPELDSRGNNRLMRCCYDFTNRVGMPESAQVLADIDQALEKKPDLLHQNHQQKTVLMLAVENSAPYADKMVEALLKKGLSPEAFTQQDSKGNTALMQAVKSGRPEMVRLLLSVPHASFEAQKGNEALQFAVQDHGRHTNKDFEIVRLLLDHPDADVHQKFTFKVFNVIPKEWNLLLSTIGGRYECGWGGEHRLNIMALLLSHGGRQLYNETSKLLTKPPKIASMAPEPQALLHQFEHEYLQADIVQKDLSDDKTTPTNAYLKEYFPVVLIKLIMDYWAGDAMPSARYASLNAALMLSLPIAPVNTAASGLHTPGIGTFAPPHKSSSQDVPMILEQDEKSRLKTS
ncbi:MAG: ankyrin repeat domain-containing protein [Gammaproteobacteria bacterium]